MIDVFTMVHVILRDAGFVTSTSTVEQTPGVCFEDDALVGYGCVFEEPAELLGKWKKIEMEFLARHAQSLRGAGEKAWNVYVVLLSHKTADSRLERQIRWIEEDLERTRKIAACGVATREELVTALLPLLPIQYRPALATEDTTERLKRRISLVAPRGSEVVLDDRVRPAEVVRLLGERT